MCFKVQTKILKQLKKSGTYITYHYYLVNYSFELAHFWPGQITFLKFKIIIFNKFKKYLVFFKTETWSTEQTKLGGGLTFTFFLGWLPYLEIWSLKFLNSQSGLSSFCGEDIWNLWFGLVWFGLVWFEEEKEGVMLGLCKKLTWGLKYFMVRFTIRREDVT